MQVWIKLQVVITRGCMIISMSISLKGPTGARLQFSIGGHWFRKRWTSSVHTKQLLIGWMRAEKMSRIGYTFTHGVLHLSNFHMFIFYKRFNLYSYLQIDDAIKIYESTEPFTIMHCWKKLRNEAKWNDKFLELNNSTSPNGMSSPPTQGHTVAGHAESGNENMDTSRPEGRDGAKRRRSNSCTETSSSSTAVEVLQRLQEKSE